jgi:hypothetical protein
MRNSHYLLLRNGHFVLEVHLQGTTHMYNFTSPKNIHHVFLQILIKKCCKGIIIIICKGQFTAAIGHASRDTDEKAS